MIIGYGIVVMLSFVSNVWCLFLIVFIVKCGCLFSSCMVNIGCLWVVFVIVILWYFICVILDNGFGFWWIGWLGVVM